VLLLLLMLLLLLPDIGLGEQRVEFPADVDPTSLHGKVRSSGKSCSLSCCVDERLTSKFFFAAHCVCGVVWVGIST
jgi:hypothetical protein